METKTIDLKGFGPVTFQPLDEAEMKQLRAQAESDPVSIGVVSSVDQRMAALVIGKAVVSPQLTDDELLTAFGARPHLLDELAAAIIEASWPN